MGYETIAVTSRGPAAQVTIDREQARNAINPQVMRELIAALEEASLDDAVRAIVITGAGEKAFCAGGDLGGGMASGAIAQHLDRAELSRLFRIMRECGKPVVARVNGHALGGGFGLMLGCDLIIAAEHAEVGTPEVNIGLWPYVITAVIQRNVPTKFATEMMMLGLRIPAARAAEIGFVNRVVPSDQLDAAVDELVEQLASKSPIVLKLGKDSYYAAQEMSFDAALSYLEGQLTLGLMAEDAMEGIQAFIQKRPPLWKGR